MWRAWWAGAGKPAALSGPLVVYTKGKGRIREAQGPTKLHTCTVWRPAPAENAFIRMGCICQGAVITGSVASGLGFSLRDRGNESSGPEALLPAPAVGAGGVCAAGSGVFRGALGCSDHHGLNFRKWA